MLLAPQPISNDLTTLEAHLAPLSQDIHLAAQLDSTSHYLLTHGKHRSVCIADSQTAGYGRNGRVWQSPAGVNIYCSLRWHFQVTPTHYSWLSLMVAVVVAEVLQRQGIRGHQIKWPNDLYYQERKFGGILLQTTASIEQVIIGIGLNVQMQTTTTPIDQPWCSLSDFSTIPSLNRATLITALVQELFDYLPKFSQLSVDALHYAWQRWDLLQQRTIAVHTPNQTLTGVACGLDGQGRLLVLDAQSVLHTFSSADVSVRL